MPGAWSKLGKGARLFSVLSDPDAQLCVLKRVDIDMSGFNFPEDRGEKDWASASRGYASSATRASSARLGAGW